MNIKELKIEIENTQDSEYERYLRIRLLKERRKQQERKALSSNRPVSLIPVNLEGEDMELFKTIDLDSIPSEEYAALNGEGDETSLE